MRILIEERGDLFTLLDDGPLMREDLEVRSVADARQAVGRSRERGLADLCLLPPDADSETLEILRRAGVPASPVASAREASHALEGVGVVSRRCPRVPLHLPIRLEGEDLEMKGLSKDLSLTGAFVRCDPALADGAAVTLHLDREGDRMSLPARVVRRVVDAQDDRMAGLGLAFWDLTTLQRRLLAEWLEEPVPIPRIPGLRYRS